MTPKKHLRPPLGFCHALREGKRCGAPAYRRWLDWLGCPLCLPDGASRNGHFSREVSLLTERPTLEQRTGGFLSADGRDTDEVLAKLMEDESE